MGLTKKIKDKKLFKKKDKGEEKKPFEKLDKEQTREKQKKEKAERKAKKLQPEVFDIGVQAKNDNEGVQKKSLKFDETVKVREIVDAPPKKMKKEKLTKKIKDKKLFKKKDKGEEKKPFEKLDKEQ